MNSCFKLFTIFRFKLIEDMNLNCGYDTQLDTGLFKIIKTQSAKINPDEEYNTLCLLMVLIAVSFPRLIRLDSSHYSNEIHGHLNNAHGIGFTINTLANCFFYDQSINPQIKIESRLNEFLALASSALLKYQELNSEAHVNSSSQTKEIFNKEAVFIILEQVVQECPLLRYDLLESCFPYALLRSSHRHLLKSDKTSNTFNSANNQ